MRIICLAPSPVFYQVPLYRAVAKQPQISLEVVYLSSEGVRPYSAGFGEGQSISWDGNLLDGYSNRMLPGAERSRVSGGFGGLQTDGIKEVVAEAKAGRAALWVHGWAYRANWEAIAYAKAMHVPLLLREEQTLLHRRAAPKRWLRAAALKGLVSGADCMYIGSHNREFFIRAGANVDRLHFVPYCVDNEEIQRDRSLDAPQSLVLRRRMQIPLGAPVVLVVGKLESKKAPDMVLRAFLRRRGDNVNAQLVFVGTGPMEVDLRAMASGRADVHFAGFVNRSALGAFYEMASITVLASQFHETWGLVVNESLNHDVMVLASDKVGSARDLLTPDLVFRHDDERELETALSTWLTNGQQRDHVGLELGERVRRWHYGVAVDGVLSAATRVLEGRSRPRGYPCDALFPLAGGER